MSSSSPSRPQNNCSDDVSSAPSSFSQSPATAGTRSRGLLRDNNSRGTNASIEVTKGVTFNKKTRVYCIEMLDEYSDEEYENTFLTDSDNRAIQEGIIETLQIVHQHNGVLPAEKLVSFSFRGLEHLTSQTTMNERSRNKIRARIAVLDEQDRQGDADVFDDERIARASTVHTEGNRIAALVRGTADAAEAVSLEQILDEVLTFPHSE